MLLVGVVLHIKEYLTQLIVLAHAFFRLSVDFVIVHKACLDLTDEVTAWDAGKEFPAKTLAVTFAERGAGSAGRAMGSGKVHIRLGEKGDVLLVLVDDHHLVNILVVDAPAVGIDILVGFAVLDKSTDLINIVLQRALAVIEDEGTKGRGGRGVVLLAVEGGYPCVDAVTECLRATLGIDNVTLHTCLVLLLVGCAVRPYDAVEGKDIGGV